METSGTETQRPSTNGVKVGEKHSFVFDEPYAKGVITVETSTYGVRVAVDGKPLANVDLYYKSPEAAKSENRGRVLLQVEAPLPEDPDNEDGWLNLYCGAAGIVGCADGAGRTLNLNFNDRRAGLVLVQGEFTEPASEPSTEATTAMPEDPTISGKVWTIVADQLGLPAPPTLEQQRTTFQELGADSLDSVEIAMAI